MAIGYAIGQRQYATRSGRIIPNVMPLIMSVDPDLNEAGFLYFYNRSGVETTRQEKFTWDVDDWAATSDTVDGAVSDTSQTFIQVDNPKYFNPGQTWINKRTGEVMWVRSVNVATSQVEFVRAYSALNSGGGTAAAAINDADTLVRMAMLVGEDNRRQTTHTTTPEEVFNFTQPFRRELEMSRRQIKREFVNDNEWSYQERKQMQEFRKEINAALLVNERARFTDSEQGDTTATAGIRSVISTYSSTVAGTLYEYDFDSFLAKKAMRHGGNKVGVSSISALLAVSEMTKDRVTYDIPLSTANQQVGITVTVYKAPNGRSLMLAEDRFLSENFDGEMYIVDFNQIKRKVFSNNGINDDLHIELDTKDPDNLGRGIAFYGDMGLYYGLEKHHAKLTGITAGASARSVA